MLFNSWESIGRTLLVGVLAYISLVAMLRFGGKRTLTQMNCTTSKITNPKLTTRVMMNGNVIAFFNQMNREWIYS